MNAYNEIELYAVKWLRRLIAAGHITQGVIHDTDIRTLQPTHIVNATRFHAFAGIGLWDYALRLAGWPIDAPVWTGSCPCQPFSVAGRKRGSSDTRHLWPEWFRLIRECRPPIILGEQVASHDGLAWFDAVSADLEGEGYAVGAADLCAAGVGAPHIRQRLYFVAYLRGGKRQTGGSLSCEHHRAGLADRSFVGDADCQRRNRLDTHIQSRPLRDDPEVAGTGVTEFAGSASWSNADWIYCRDGRYRPVEPGTFPLAHGHSGRVAFVRPGEQTEEHWYNRAGALKCIGNAIVPQVAAVFIRAVMELIARK